MRLLLAMVGKDLRRRLRSPLPTILLLLFPLLFAGLIALTFGGGNQVPKVRLLIDDRDGGLVAQLVTAAFQRGEAQTYFEVETLPSISKDTDAQLLESREATALLRLPAGLSDDVLAGRPAKLLLVKSPAQSILPDVAEQATTVLAEGLSSASRLLRGPLDQIRATATPNRAPNPASNPASNPIPSDQRVAEIAVLTNGVVTRARPYLFPPVITLETATLETATPGKPGSGKPGPAPTPSLFLLFLPGISVFALFNLADQSMRDLLVEARLKTLRRQFAGPLTAGRVLAGKALSTAAVAGLSILTLTVVGAVVVAAGAGGAHRGFSLAGFLLLSFALVAATTGFASFLFGLARNERQGATLASLVSLVMAFAGGSFLPLDSLPPALRALSPFSLMYWATRGYQALLVDGAGLRAVLPSIAILTGSGLLLLALSAFLWQRRLLKGELA